MGEEENTRRITELGARLESIDQHGTRGMESVRVQLGGVERDMGKLESTVGRVETAIQAVQVQMASLKPRSPWPPLLAYAGILVPMYALVIDLIVQHLR